MLETLISAGLPVALIIVMTGVGLGLTLEDFRRVVQQPKGFLVGSLAQLLLLPLVAWLLIKLLGLTGPVAIGVFIIALCPGGTTSNLFSMLARADVGLSVSLTAVVGFITPFTIPLLAGWAIEQLSGESTLFALPLLETFTKLIVVGVLPVIVGMSIRARWTGFAQRAEPWVHRGSTVVLAVLIVVICLQLGEHLLAAAAAAGLAALLLNLSTMGLGYALGAGLLKNSMQTKTIALEVGLQNGTMALLITSGMLKSPEMSMGPIVYSLLMFATAGLFTFVVRRRA